MNNIVLLNIHEYVHTQQKPMVHNLLSQCLYEGVAEFVSVTVMETESAAPAIRFGKANEAAVRQKFEHDMFRGNKTYEWLWGDADNGFGVRDLGYYIGYEMCERYYHTQKDKQAAIKKLIELDYENEDEISTFVDGTGFLSQSLDQLYSSYEAARPTVVRTTPNLSGDVLVNPALKQIVLHFSEPMDTRHRGFDFGPLGEPNVLSVQRVVGFSDDAKSFTFEVSLEPGKRYQSLVTNRFMSATGMPLNAFLIDIKTKD